VDWSQEAFDRVRSQFEDFSERLDLADVVFLPISALLGDNVVSISKRMPGYSGRSGLQHLEEVHVASDLNRLDLRLPIQCCLGDGTLAGTIASGMLRADEQILALPSQQSCRVRSIAVGSTQFQEAEVPMAVSLTLEGAHGIGRGGMIVRPANMPQIGREVDATVCWMVDAPIEPGLRFILQHTTHRTRCVVDQVHYRIDIDTLHRIDSRSLGLNDIGRVVVHADEPLLFDAYRRNRTTGSFILIDERTLTTAGAGMIR